MSVRPLQVSLFQLNNGLCVSSKFKFQGLDRSSRNSLLVFICSLFQTVGPFHMSLEEQKQAQKQPPPKNNQQDSRH